ncbi:MAG: peptide chain release factor 1 [Firmicutes bacterium]|jgi:peptide chain release factor 1|nr:peptide chain release factor 1 [Bacillota bacterium]
MIGDLSEQDLARLTELQNEYKDVMSRLASPDIFSDQRQYLELSRRRKSLEAIVAITNEIAQIEGDISAAKELMEAASHGEKELLRAEVTSGEERALELANSLKDLLIPEDPNAGRNVIMTVRGAEGGEEANLFAKDLFDMYLRYMDRRGYKVQIMEIQNSDLGGLSDVTFQVKGDDAWVRLKHEGGVHRVQRVPVTESQGRLHTSSAAVTVLPEADEVEVDIDPNDLQIDVYRSTGPGGQSVNTTDSAVRITHIPSGLVVAMQDEKSQIQNRAKALIVLRSRLLKLEQDRLQEELSTKRRSQVGTGGRSEKIRTYNFKENRVTDHRIGLTLYKLDKFLTGEMDEMIDALLADERAKQLSGD